MTDPTTDRLKAEFRRRSKKKWWDGSCWKIEPDTLIDVEANDRGWPEELSVERVESFIFGKVVETVRGDERERIKKDVRRMRENYLTGSDISYGPEANALQAVLASLSTSQETNL